MTTNLFEGYHYPVSTGSVTQIMESMLYMNESTTAQFRSLKEAGQNVASSNFVRTVVRAAEKLFDYNAIAGPVMKTAGDVSKVDHYSQFIEVHKYFVRQLPNDPTIQAVETVHQFLVKNKSLFKMGFAQENRNVQMLYFSLVNSMLLASVLITTTYCDFLAGNKDSTYMPTLRSYDIKDLNVQNLRGMANDIRQGKVYSFLSESVVKGASSLKESFVLPAVFATCIAVFWFIRDFIVYFFKVRKSMSEWFESYSIFLELRANAISGNNKKASETYVKLSDKFMSISKFIRVEAEVTSKETVQDVKRISSSPEKMFVSKDDQDAVVF